MLLSCPPNELLERFLLGLTDEASAREIEAHAADCADCRRTMEQATAVDAWVRALADARGDEREPLVDLLAPRFKQIPGALSATIPPPVIHNAETSDWAHQPTQPTCDQKPAKLRDRLGPYELRGELGRGGMGMVLEAYDPRLQRPIAIKVLQAERFVADEWAERILGEARAAAAVENDHITPVYAVEMVDGAPCIVMPLLRGKTLQQRMEEARGPLPLAEILRLGIETATGLAAAHACGLVHRDIKPANLWLESPQDRVKILDFGLALARSDAAQSTGEVAGTPGFLAPEQAEGKAVDARADLFSLGCVLYVAATGKQAFSGPSHLRAMWTLLSEAPPAAHSVTCDLPVALSDLIARLLARRPEDRPKSADEVRAELERIARRPFELRQLKIRRRWMAALFGAAAASALTVAVWAAMTMQSVLPPVDVTLHGEPNGLKIVLEHAGRETATDLSGRKLALPPGDYFLRPATMEAGRALIPSRFTVLPAKPLVLQVALVGEISRHETHSQPVQGVAVSGEAEALQIFSAGLDRVLVAWNGTIRDTPRFVNLPQSVRCLSLNANGAEVAFAGGNKSAPFETAVGRRRAADFEPQGSPLEGHQRFVVAVAYAPDGTQLASAAADGVFIWDLANGERRELAESAQQPTNAIAFSSDGKRLLAVTATGAVTVWDVATGLVLKSLQAGNVPLHAVVNLSNGFAVAGADGAVRAWNYTTFESQVLYEHPVAVRSLATSADGTLILSGDADGAIRVCGLPSGRTIHTFEGHRGAVNALAITANGRRAVSGGADHTVRLWQLPFP